MDDINDKITRANRHKSETTQSKIDEILYTRDKYLLKPYKLVNGVHPTSNTCRENKESAGEMERGEKKWRKEQSWQQMRRKQERRDNVKMSGNCMRRREKLKKRLE